jgi:hypothetical protein
VRSGLQRAPSNRDLTRENNRTTAGEEWGKYHAGNEGGRIQRLQEFEAGGHSETSGLGWTSTGKNHSGRGHATSVLLNK